MGFLRIIIKRFTELLLINLILSFFTTLVFIGGMVPETNINLAIGVSSMAAIFLGINIYMLRNDFMDMITPRVYFISNYIAYFLFIAVNAIAYKNFGNEVYTVMFAITKFARFLPYSLTVTQAAAIFHGVMLGVILITPLTTWRAYVREPKEMPAEFEYEE